MTSRVPSKRVRKTPEARRAEIVAAAAEIALAEGLELITVRRVAEELSVRPGLISHYFPVAEDLVAEAFGDAATGELDQLLPALRPEGQALRSLVRFFSLTGGERYDDISRLWLNARHLSRYRTSLAERVAHQESLWRDRLTELIRAGVDEGAFDTDDPLVAAVSILVVLDGLGVHANTDRSDRPRAVTVMAATTAERALGLAPETLAPHALASAAPRTTRPPASEPPTEPPTADPPTD